MTLLPVAGKQSDKMTENNQKFGIHTSHNMFEELMLLHCDFPSFRPKINDKFEEHAVGEGPSLAAIFEDDKHLHTLINNTNVSFWSAKLC